MIRKLETLTLIFPVYNEEEVLPFLFSALERFLDSSRWQVSILFVDDGSRDRSVELIKEWSETRPNAKLISFSRNFGHQAALTAGLDWAEGDAVVILDADLQDPIEVVPDMVREFEAGFDIVYGKRRRREGESIFKKVTAWFFYRLMRTLALKELPLDTGDFRLVSRQVVESVRDMHEYHRFLRGIFAWSGYRQTFVEYDRAERAAGETKYPLSKMIGFAWDAIISFSSLPLRISSFGGFFIAFLGLIYAGVAFYTWLQGNTVPGWSSLVILYCLISGFTLVCLGMVGEYIGRIYDESKRRPIYLVQETLNIEKRTTSKGN